MTSLFCFFQSPVKPVKQVKPADSAPAQSKEMLHSLPQGITISKVSAPVAPTTPAKQVKPRLVNSSPAKPVSKAGPQSKVRKGPLISSFSAPKPSTSKTAGTKTPMVTITPIEASSLPPLKLKLSAAATAASSLKAATATTSSSLKATAASAAASRAPPHRNPGPKSKKKLPEVKIKVRCFTFVVVYK